MKKRFELPRYLCPKVAPFDIDGRLKSPQWRHAKPVRLRNTTGEVRQLQATTIRLCYSEEALYLSYRITDSAIECTFTQRDSPLYEEDTVEAFLSPTGDLHHYFEFEFNALNTLFDARVFSPHLNRREMEVDTAWNAEGLRCASSISQNRGGKQVWSVEVALPFQDLETATPIVGDLWRMNLYRIDLANGGEFSAWSPTLAIPADFHVPERFGWLEFGDFVPQ